MVCVICKLRLNTAGIQEKLKQKEKKSLLNSVLGKRWTAPWEMITFVKQWVPGSMLGWPLCLHQIWQYSSPTQGPWDGAQSPGKAIKFPLIRLSALALQPQSSHSDGLHVFARATPSCWHPSEALLFKYQYCAQVLSVCPSLRQGECIQHLAYFQPQRVHLTGWLSFLLR